MTSHYPIPQLPGPGVGPTTAQERAARLLQSRYGDQAQDQIRQLQQQAARGNQGQQRDSGVQLPNYEAKIKQEPLPDFEPQPNQHPVPKTDQTDGAGESLDEWETELERRRDFTKRHLAEGDRLIHEQYLASQQRLEGGGLLLPLAEKIAQGHGTKRKLVAYSSPDADAPSAPSIANPSPSRAIARAQLDGGDDDDDPQDLKDDILDDEDAINSDLDDPDELAEDADGDDEVGQNMYCTYDKVQRVKNKWKCTMKDGILTAGGKE